MHCTKLGIGHHVIGNGLVYLATERAYRWLGPAVSVELPHDVAFPDVLDDLNLRFKEWLKDHGLECSHKRFTPLRVHRAEATSTPYYACKASQCVPMVSWLASMAHEYSEVCPAGKRDEARTVAGMLWALSQYFNICKTSDRFFTPQQVRDLDEAAHTFLHLYSELRRMSAERDTHMWQIVPKFHQFHHIVLDACEDSYNPRFFHCFSDEDQVGRLITLAAAAHPTTVVATSIGLYIVAMARRIKLFR